MSPRSRAAVHSDTSVLLDSVVHRYPAFTLGPVSLAVGTGVVHALLGPNGNGKTTLINLLMGLLRPSSGTVRVLGQSPRADGGALYADIGFSPDDDDLVDELSAEEYWQLCATVLSRQGVDRAEALDRAFEHAARLSFTPPNRLIGGYSHGMRRKTQLVAALLHDPRLIVLDEPTNGLDPISAFSLGELLREHAASGAAVVVATHDLAWAERFTDVVTLVRAGVISAKRPTTDVLRPTERSTLLDGFMAAAQALVGDADTTADHHGHDR